MSNNPNYARSSLALDFSLSTAEARAQHIEKLFSERGAAWTPSAKEQEIIANYLLYGIDESGKSPVQSKEILGQSSTYSKRPPESLDQLVESPVFNEYSVSQIGGRTQYRIPKPRLDRDAYKKTSKPEELSQMESLWNTIDQVDSILQQQKNGERNLPLKRYYYLRHLLVDLRREQYTLKDFWRPSLYQHIQPVVYRGGETDEAIFGVSETVQVLPLGFYQKGDPKFEDPGNRRNPNYLPPPAKYEFDFRNSEHIYQLVQYREELETQAELDPESAIVDLLNTFDFYCGLANLNKIHLRLLNLKTLHWTNEDIRRTINSEYGTKYSVPYISTIFTHQICPSIAEAAILHYDFFLGRSDESKWKVCTGCNRRLLRDQRIFSKYTRAKDGLQSKCKECDKKDREERALRNKQKALNRAKETHNEGYEQ